MMHLDDGTLQAFLDHELPPAERAAAAKHLLACAACHGEYEALTRANALFSRSVAALDTAGVAAAPDPPPLQDRGAARPAAGRAARPGVGRGVATFVKAAGLVLALAAAASAAVPGSPVRAWIATTFQDPEAQPADVEAAPSAEPVAAPVSGAEAGVSMGAASGSLVVALSGLEGAEIRLETQPGDRAIVRATGGARDPSFVTRSGRLDVQGGSGGAIRVGLPRAVPGARLEVDGRAYAEMRAGGLAVLVPADTVEGVIVWR